MAGSAPVRQASSPAAQAASLFERVKTGDERAFNELYLSHIDRVMAVVRRIVQEADTAEEIANGVFAKVWQVRNSDAAFSSKNGSTFSTWLTRIAINDARMYLRKNRPETHHVAFSLDDMVEADDNTHTGWLPATHDLNLEGIFDRKSLAHAISQLQSKYRTVFELRLIHNLTNEEVGRRLNLEITQVKSRLYHSRRMLRRILFRQSRIRVAKTPRAAV